MLNFSKLIGPKQLKSVFKELLCTYEQKTRDLLCYFLVKINFSGLNHCHPPFFQERKKIGLHLPPNSKSHKKLCKISLIHQKKGGVWEEMQNGAAAVTVREKMEQLRLKCNRDLQIQQQSIDAGAISFWKSLDSTKTQARQTLQFQGKIEILHLRLWSFTSSEICIWWNLVCQTFPFTNILKSISLWRVFSILGLNWTLFKKRINFFSHGGPFLWNLIIK